MIAALSSPRVDNQSVLPFERFPHIGDTSLMVARGGVVQFWMIYGTMVSFLPKRLAFEA